MYLCIYQIIYDRFFDVTRGEHSSPPTTMNNASSAAAFATWSCYCSSCRYYYELIYVCIYVYVFESKIKDGKEWEIRRIVPTDRMCRLMLCGFSVVVVVVVDVYM